MKTNNPLTVDSIISILNQQNYKVEQFTLNTSDPNRFKQIDYHKMVKLLLDHYFIDYKSVDIPKEDDQFFGATILLNEKIKYKWIENFSLIEFTSMYPTITSKLIKSNEIQFNIPEFGVLFSFMADNRRLIKSDPSLTEASRLLFNYIINFTYGATMSSVWSRSLLQMNGHSKIAHYAKDIYEKLFNDYPHNIFYIDADTIYLDFITPEVLSKIKSLEIPYTIETNLSGMFIEKKKYVISRGGDVKPIGLRGGFRSKYQKEKNRINKLQKILNKIDNATN